MKGPKAKKQSIDYPERAMNFLRPTLVTNGKKTFFVIFLKGFEDVKVGHLGNVVQFDFKKFPDVYPDLGNDLNKWQVLETKMSESIRWELPPDFEIVSRSVTDLWKGVEVKRTEMKPPEKQGFDMV